MLCRISSTPLSLATFTLQCFACPFISHSFFPGNCLLYFSTLSVLHYFSPSLYFVSFPPPPPPVSSILPSPSPSRALNDDITDTQAFFPIGTLRQRERSYNMQRIWKHKTRFTLQCLCSGFGYSSFSELSFPLSDALPFVYFVVPLFFLFPSLFCIYVCHLFFLFRPSFHSANSLPVGEYVFSHLHFLFFSSSYSKTPAVSLR